MTRRILMFRPEHDGFQFSNSWTFTEEDRDYLVQQLEGPANHAIFAVGMSVHIIPIAGGIVEATLGGLTGLGPLALPVALGIAILAGAGSDLVRGVANSVNEGGMCGGMAHSAIDYWNKSWVIPGGTNPPGNPGTPYERSPESMALRAYIRERLADTLRSHIGDFLWAWAKTGLSMDNAPFMPFRTQLATELQKITGRIDAGELVTLGVVGSSPDPTSMHQVVCYGYEEPAAGRWSAELFIYDPNAPCQDKRIKLDLRPSNGNLSEIWTDMVTTAKVKIPKSNETRTVGISPGRKNWLSYLFAVDYSPKTPPETLTSSSLRIVSSDGVGRLRVDVPVEVEADLTYRGAETSLELAPYLQMSRAAGGAVADVGPATSGKVRISAGQTVTASWKTLLPGAPGSLDLDLLAFRTGKDLDPGKTYYWKRKLRDAAGTPVNASVTARALPDLARIEHTFSGPVPQLDPAGGLRYSIDLSVADRLGPGARYSWQVRDTNAKTNLSTTAGGSLARAETFVDPRSRHSAAVQFDVEGIDNALDESRGSVEVSLPQATARLTADLSKSVPYGLPRMRNPSGPGWIAQKAVLMQAYETIMVRLDWLYLAGPPTKVEWVLGDCSKVFCPPPAADLSSGCWEIPVSMVGANDPANPGQQHAPAAVMLKCTVEDAAGQQTTASAQIEPWHASSYFIPGSALPYYPGEAVDRFLEVLPEVRERLTETLVSGLPDIVAGRVTDRIERTIMNLTNMEVGEFESLVRDVFPEMDPEDRIFGSIRPDQEAIRVEADKELALDGEVNLDYDELEHFTPQVTGDVAVVGEIEFTHTPQLAPDGELKGGELLAELGFEGQ